VYLSGLFGTRYAKTTAAALNVKKMIAPVIRCCPLGQRKLGMYGYICVAGLIGIGSANREP
jgi:hypothetical protein